MAINETLAEIQLALKAPKSQNNDFGKYKYRKCEDILEAIKPILNGATITLSDDIVEVAGRVYVKATAMLAKDGESVSVTGFARETQAKKGMDEAQITGAASSYARKYALNGLLAIDDTKDADSFDNSNTSSFVLDQTAKDWVQIVKGDPTQLIDIQDPEYREFIKQQAGIK